MPGPGKNDDQVLLNFEPRFVARKFDRDVEKSEKKFQKQIGKMSKAFNSLGGAVKNVANKTSDWLDTQKAKSEANNRLLKRSLSVSEDIVELSGRLASTYGKERAEVEKEIKVLEERHRISVSSMTQQVKKLQMAKVATMKLRQEEDKRKFEALEDVVSYGSDKAGEDLAEGFVEALGSISSRDLSGFARGLVKSMGAAGKYMEGAGLRMQARGADKGGIGGGAMKALGGLMKGIGPMLNVVGKMGPLVTTLSTMLMSVVKLFLDVDAAAKDFNKQILDTTGTAGFLSKNLGRSAAAAADVKQTLADMYDSAVGLENLRWGISKETHTQVLGALGAEGVQLEKTAKYFDDIKTGAAAATGYVKDWASVTQLSVSYSRAFGVSLGEITQFQGEMMTEMGMSFDSVEASLEQVASQARDSGIGVNKFFNQIRGMSADLGLFNLRMADAAKLMAKLDKTMSPRHAQEFMNTITHMFKSMGLVERTKSVLLGGRGKTKDLLQKDLAGKLDGLAQDIDLKLGKGTGEELMKIINKPKALMKFMAKHQDKLDGSTREAILDASRMSGKLAKGGLVDVASALKDASPMAAIDHLDDIAKNFFKKPVEDLSDVERVAFENLTNVSDEQVDQLYKFKQSLDQGQEDLATKIEDGTDLTDDEKALLKKLNIGEKGKEAADELRHQDARKIWDNMSKSQQDALRDANKTIDQAKRQGDLTQSILDKVGVLFDWLVGKLYPVFGSIWDSVLDIVDKITLGQGDQRKLAKIQAQAIKDGNSAIADIAQSSADLTDFRFKLMNSDLGKQVADNLLDVGKKLDANQKKDKDLKEKHAKADSEEERKNIEKQLTANDAEKKALKDQMGQMAKAIEQQLGGREALGRNKGDIQSAIAQSVTDAGSMAKLDPEAVAAVAGSLKKGNTLSGSLMSSSLTQEQQAQLLEKLRWTLSAQQLGKAMADATKGTAAARGIPDSPTTGATAATTAAAPPSAQQATPGDVKDAASTQAQATQDTTNEQTHDLRMPAKGVVLNSTFMKNTFSSSMEEAVYNGASKALFEYWMYQETDRTMALAAIKKGTTSAGTYGANILKGAFAEGAGGDPRTAAAILAKGNANGGTVLKPAPGEVLASVAPGEYIVPPGVGGGATKVVLELKGDMLKQIIRAQAMDTINEHDRKKALR